MDRRGRRLNASVQDEDVGPYAAKHGRSEGTVGDVADDNVNAQPTLDRSQARGVARQHGDERLAADQGFDEGEAETAATACDDDAFAFEILHGGVLSYESISSRRDSGRVASRRSSSRGSPPSRMSASANRSAFEPSQNAQAASRSTRSRGDSASSSASSSVEASAVGPSTVQSRASPALATSSWHATASCFLPVKGT
jgi:hypothetical protein